MDHDLAQKAVSVALSGNWSEAIKLNKQILVENPKDIDALNRIARAFAETGKIEDAKKYTEKSLKIDPFNRIAQKSLKKWHSLKSSTASPENTTGNGHTLPNIFLEEPGKTTICSLLFPGDSKVIASLDCGDEVFLSPHSHRVSINNNQGKYIGRLADDLAARIRKFLKTGNEYRVFVKSIDETNVKVFIKEVKRAEKLIDLPSFPAEKIDYASFTPPELVHKKENYIPNVIDEE